MTTESTHMTPEQKIIAIAEWEGIPTKKVWRLKYKDQFFDYKTENEAIMSAAYAVQMFGIDKADVGKPEEAEVPTRLPPYLTSRDAICGAVARLNNMEFCYFVEHLERVCKTDGWEIMGSDDRRRMLLATPAQLADALLLTLGYEL